MIFCQILATVVAEAHPEAATVERMVRQRRPDAVYIDYLQNIHGKTLACAYSARASPFAGVSTPLTWAEVHEGVAAGLRPHDFTMRSIFGRLERRATCGRGCGGRGLPTWRPCSPTRTAERRGQDAAEPGQEPAPQNGADSCRIWLDTGRRLIRTGRIPMNRSLTRTFTVTAALSVVFALGIVLASAPAEAQRFPPPDDDRGPEDARRVGRRARPARARHPLRHGRGRGARLRRGRGLVPPRRRAGERRRAVQPGRHVRLRRGRPAGLRRGRRLVPAGGRAGTRRRAVQPGIQVLDRGGRDRRTTRRRSPGTGRRPSRDSPPPSTAWGYKYDAGEGRGAGPRGGLLLVPARRRAGTCGGAVQPRQPVRQRRRRTPGRRRGGRVVPAGRPSRATPPRRATSG